MFYSRSFDPQEYLKMLRSAMSTVFLVMYDDYDELEELLSRNGIDLIDEEDGMQ